MVELRSEHLDLYLCSGRWFGSVVNLKLTSDQELVLVSLVVSLQTDVVLQRTGCS